MVRHFERYNEEQVKKINGLYGVYALAVGLKNSDEVRVFYVGSGDIRDRLLYHLSDNEENECIKKKVRGYVCYFWYEEVTGGEEKRKVRESQILEAYRKQGNAECNKITP